MTFRHISELAGDVMRRVEIEASNRGSDERAPALRPATGNRVATGHGEGAKPVAFAQSGDTGPAEQTGMRKMAEPGSPAKLEVQEERQSEDNRGEDQVVIPRLSNRKHTLTVLPVSKRMKVARPTGVAPRHAAFIRLVTVNGHAVTHPHATAR